MHWTLQSTLIKIIKMWKWKVKKKPSWKNNSRKLVNSSLWRFSWNFHISESELWMVKIGWSHSIRNKVRNRKPQAKNILKYKIKIFKTAKVHKYKETLSKMRKNIDRSLLHIDSPLCIKKWFLQYEVFSKIKLRYSKKTTKMWKNLVTFLNLLSNVK